MMNTQKIKRGGWLHILRRAESEIKEDRQIALIRAYCWVEHALDAAGISGPKRPIANRILRTLNSNVLDYDIDPQKIRFAIKSRHKAGHEDTVPDVTSCVESVNTLKYIWSSLSRSFVNIEMACSVGEALLEDPYITKVCLYGSMARNDPNPNDIDFLILDDGFYSYKIKAKYDAGDFDSFQRTIDTLKWMGINDKKLELAAKCRWLDIFILNGQIFGHNFEYTKYLKEIQPDPWFFRNISLDLMEFDIENNSFVGANFYPFNEVKITLNKLHSIGL